MNHPNDDVLSDYALDPTFLSQRSEVETHLDACASCRERLNAIRAFDCLLRDPDSWHDQSGCREALLRQSLMAEREDESAEELLRPFLARPSGTLAWANLAGKPKYHTGGVVRRLTTHADRASYSQPLHALLVADVAISVAAALSEDRYASSELASWRGMAWWTRANAQRHLGRYPEAFESLDRAERHFRLLPRPELDLAQVTFTRAAILYEQEEYDRAEELAVKCTADFAQFGQTELYMKGRLLQASIAYEKRNLMAAEQMFRQIHQYGEATASTTWVARASQALGHCLIEKGSLDDAAQHFTTALRLFREQGLSVEEIRCRWGIARVAQKSGDPAAAIPRLQSVRDEFAKCGVNTDAALVTLDLMETYLTMRKWRDVTAAAGNVVELFRQAGVLTGALTAANWLKHAARMKAVSPSILQQLRSYFRRVELQPDVAFVPPVATEL